MFKFHRELDVLFTVTATGWSHGRRREGLSLHYFVPIQRSIRVFNEVVALDRQ